MVKGSAPWLGWLLNACALCLSESLPGLSLHYPPVYFPDPCLCFWISSQINCFPLNLCLKVCLWGSLAYVSDNTALVWFLHAAHLCNVLNMVPGRWCTLSNKQALSQCFIGIDSCNPHSNFISDTLHLSLF